MKKMQFVLLFSRNLYNYGTHAMSFFSVEFPAVLLNTCNGDIEEKFHHYVQPQENPTLSDFCKNFTGITQVNAEHEITSIWQFSIGVKK